MREMQKVIHDSVGEIGLMEFMRLDHGIPWQTRSRWEIPRVCA